MINLYIIDYDNPLKNNGLSTYLNELIRILPTQQGINLHCVWVNSTKYTGFFRERINGVTHLYIPKNINVPTMPSEFDVKCAAFLVDDMQGKENIIVHFNWINHCTLAWHLKRRINCKTVLTKHCIPWRDLVTTDSKEFWRLNHALEHRRTVPITHPLLKKEQISYESIDHIIAISQHAKQSLEVLFGVSPDKISVINNGLSFPARRRIDKSELRKKYGFSSTEKIILFAGNVNQRKGIFDLLRAFELLVDQKGFGNSRLVIAGGGEHGAVLKKSKEKWAKITLTGNLDKKTLFDFYALADIGVMPSYVEQNGYSAIEMMYSGLPVIVSDVDGLREIVPGDCGFKISVSYHKTKGATLDINDLKDKLAFLITNHKKAKMLADRAKKYAREQLSAKKMIAKTLAVYYALQRITPSNHTDHLDKIRLDPKNGVAEKPLVSILLAYSDSAQYIDSERYLNLSLDSIVNQSYSNVEVILVDCSSSSKMKALVDGFKRGHIRYAKLDTSKKMAQCFNKGIEMAKGKYTAHMNVGDIMNPMRLVRQVDFLEKNLVYGLAGSWCEIIDDSGMPVNRIQQPTDDPDIRLALLFRNPMIHSSVTVRTELAKNILYDGDFNHYEAHELWARASKEVKIANIPEYLISCSLNDTRTSSQAAKTARQHAINLFSRELDNLGVQHTPEELVTHAAISFGYGVKYFNTPRRIGELRKWLDKVLTAEHLVIQHGPTKLSKFKRYALESYCYI